MKNHIIVCFILFCHIASSQNKIIDVNIQNSPLEKFNTEYLPLLSFTISLLSILGLYYVYKQLKQTEILNRINHSIEIENLEFFFELDRKLRIQLSKIEINSMVTKKQITNDELNKIIAEDELFFDLRNYLAYLEHLSVSILIGATNEEYLYQKCAGRITRAYIMFEPYIKHCRELYNDKEFLVNFEELASKWKKVKEKRQMKKKLFAKKL